MNHTELDTKTLLINWGIWASKSPINSLCYPSTEPYRRMYSVPGEISPPVIDDKAALVADRILASMIARDETTGVLTALYYLTGASYQALAERVNRKVKGANLNRKGVSALVSAGESWFEGFYFGIAEAANG
ncbi:hypothetical protein [Gilvimarinus chinensis]|uniref:hypothetical protein n=1 Tax=Gilvimarinus chinensis TaxID=396005 RepID=UPI00037E2594|nr:hypothetical protein [Gilvimarinus chinensis]